MKEEFKKEVLDFYADWEAKCNPNNAGMAFISVPFCRQDNWAGHVVKDFADFLLNEVRSDLLKKVSDVNLRIKKRIIYWEDRRSPCIAKVLRSVLLDVEELEEELK